MKPAPVKESRTFFVAGDAPTTVHDAPGVLDPTGQSRAMGKQFSVAAGAMGHVMLLYKIPHSDQHLILEADVHEDPDSPGKLGFLLLICPRCQANGRTNALRIHPNNKRIHFDPNGKREPFPGWSAKEMKTELPGGKPLGGLLSVEAFQCTWEESPEIRRGHGLSACGWRVTIDRNIIRDV